MGTEGEEEAAAAYHSIFCFILLKKKYFDSSQAKIYLSFEVICSIK